MKAVLFVFQQNDLKSTTLFECIRRAVIVCERRVQYASCISIYRDIHIIWMMEGVCTEHMSESVNV